MRRAVVLDMRPMEEQPSAQNDRHQGIEPVLKVHIAVGVLALAREQKGRSLATGAGLYPGTDLRY